MWKAYMSVFFNVFHGLVTVHILFSLESALPKAYNSTTSWVPKDKSKELLIKMYNWKRWTEKERCIRETGGDNIGSKSQASYGWNKKKYLAVPMGMLFLIVRNYRQK